MLSLPSPLQVLIKILKHFIDSPSSETSGQLLGLDLNGTLEIADAFAFPQLPQSERGADEEKERAAGRAASTSSRLCFRRWTAATAAPQMVSPSRSITRLNADRPLFARRQTRHTRARCSSRSGRRRWSTRPSAPTLPRRPAPSSRMRSLRLSQSTRPSAAVRASSCCMVRPRRQPDLMASPPCRRC